jgi:hypothetical protein
MRPRPLLATPDRVVFATRHQVFALEAGTGRRLWSMGENPAGWDAPDADHENFPAYRFHADHGDRLASFRDDGHAECRDVSDGTTRWSRRLEIPPTGSPAFGDEVIAYPARRQGGPICVVLDAATGESRHILPLGRDVQVERIDVGLEGRVIVLAGRTLHAFDAATGRRDWHVNFDQSVSANSVWVAYDGVYVSLDGYQVHKFRLSDGRLIWRSASWIAHGDRNVRIQARGGLVFALSDEMAILLDEIDGGMVFTPSLPLGVGRGPWFVTRRHLMLLEESAPDDSERPVLSLHVFDHQAVAATTGKVTRKILGEFEDLKNVMVCDDAVVIQDGRRVVGWSSGK